MALFMVGCKRGMFSKITKDSRIEIRELSYRRPAGALSGAPVDELGVGPGVGSGSHAAAAARLRGFTSPIFFLWRYAVVLGGGFPSSIHLLYPDIVVNREM